MDSAISRAKLLNAKGVPVSINFLAQPPLDKAKANYITTTYLQLVREIARLGIKASVHLKFDQLGSNISAEYASSNLESILAMSRKYGVFVWCELNDPLREFSLLNQIKDAKGLGLCVGSIEDALEYSKKHKPLRELKVTCASRNDGEKEAKQDSIESIEQIAKGSKSLILMSPKDSSVAKLTKNTSKYRKSLIFEFQLGYGDKKLNKMIRKGARLSIYIPFGKDWASYAMKNVPHRYMRLLASSLLSEQKKTSV